MFLTRKIKCKLLSLGLIAWGIFTRLFNFMKNQNIVIASSQAPLYSDVCNYIGWSDLFCDIV